MLPWPSMIFLLGFFVGEMKGETVADRDPPPPPVPPRTRRPRAGVTRDLAGDVGGVRRFTTSSVEGLRLGVVGRTSPRGSRSRRRVGNGRHTHTHTHTHRPAAASSSDPSESTDVTDTRGVEAGGEALSQGPRGFRLGRSQERDDGVLGRGAFPGDTIRHLTRGGCLRGGAGPVFPVSGFPSAAGAGVFPPRPTAASRAPTGARGADTSREPETCVRSAPTVYSRGIPSRGRSRTGRPGSRSTRGSPTGLARPTGSGRVRLGDSASPGFPARLPRAAARASFLRRLLISAASDSTGSAASTCRRNLHGVMFLFPAVLTTPTARNPPPRREARRAAARGRAPRRPRRSPPSRANPTPEEAARLSPAPAGVRTRTRSEYRRARRRRVVAATGAGDPRPRRGVTPPLPPSPSRTRTRAPRVETARRIPSSRAHGDVPYSSTARPRARGTDTRTGRPSRRTRQPSRTTRIPGGTSSSATRLRRRVYTSRTPCTYPARRARGRSGGRGTRRGVREGFGGDRPRPPTRGRVPVREIVPVPRRGSRRRARSERVSP